LGFSHLSAQRFKRLTRGIVDSISSLEKAECCGSSCLDQTSSAYQQARKQPDLSSGFDRLAILILVLVIGSYLGTKLPRKRQATQNAWT
jgi:hypothetical protein